MNQIINMVIRIIMRKAINSGINAGIGAFGRKGAQNADGGGGQQPIGEKNHAQQRQVQASAQQAKKLARVAGRITRF